MLASYILYIDLYDTNIKYKIKVKSTNLKDTLIISNNTNK
ncbi:MAG: hypothetical protein Terrestrivirus2_19 [Terrestrivirus sp.]|uniref:Uncharacterized protein n=1 Tax=Terrestrivirus sp. TaxID=2487775 RepID=A0A3G4ZNF9_9VIRU|nr:MAG: hypothetical protein Terrestrivirus2_19 [Terrestrivirus sp.]